MEQLFSLIIWTNGLRKHQVLTVAVINKHNSEFAPSVSNLHVCIAGDVLECFHLFNIENVTFTSAGVGTLDGQGEVWWGIPGIGKPLIITRFKFTN